MKKLTCLISLTTLFYLSTFAFSSVLNSEKDISIRVGILNFFDDSHYHGKEAPSEKIPSLLGGYLSQIKFLSFVSSDTIKGILGKKGLSSSDMRIDDEEWIKEACQILPVDVLILGNLKEFNLTRFSVGNPMLGGYGSYKSIVAMRVKLVRTLDNKLLLDTVVEGREGEKDLDITLLGKPTRIMREFMGFEQLSFDPDKFKETLIGKATFRAFEQLKEQIEQVLKPPEIHSSNRHGLAPPTVIMVQNEVAYLNVGPKDGVNIGDKFVIQRQGPKLVDPKTGALLGYVQEEVGVVQIVQIESDHLSKARILKGMGEIKAGDFIK